MADYHEYHFVHFAHCLPEIQRSGIYLAFLDVAVIVRELVKEYHDTAARPLFLQEAGKLLHEGVEDIRVILVVQDVVRESYSAPAGSIVQLIVVVEIVLYPAHYLVHHAPVEAAFPAV